METSSQVVATQMTVLDRQFTLVESSTDLSKNVVNAYGTVGYYLNIAEELSSVDSNLPFVYVATSLKESMTPEQYELFIKCCVFLIDSQDYSTPPDYFGENNEIINYREFDGIGMLANLIKLFGFEPVKEINLIAAANILKSPAFIHFVNTKGDDLERVSKAITGVVLDKLYTAAASIVDFK